MERRAVQHSWMAVSLASLPELTKNTLASGMPDSAEMRSANSTIGRTRYSVERVQHAAGLGANGVYHLGDGMARSWW